MLLQRVSLGQTHNEVTEPDFKAKARQQLELQDGLGRGGVGAALADTLSSCSPSARPQVQQGAACSSNTTILLSWEASIPPI